MGLCWGKFLLGKGGFARHGWTTNCLSKADVKALFQMLRSVVFENVDMVKPPRGGQRDRSAASK
jgi:hypothetical protein